MKKIKLLTALSTLSLLGVSSMPLTSCGSNDSGSSDPVKPEGEKTKESTDGTSTFTFKFDTKPDDGKANVSITNSSSTNQVEIKTTSNASSTCVDVGDDLKVNIQIGFISIPTSECEVRFSLTITYTVNGQSTTVTINDLVIKYTPSTIKYNITFNKGDHGTIDIESISVPSGTSWSVIEKPTVTPEKGYSFSKWVDNNGNEIQDSYKITSNFTAIATYIQVPAEKYTITFDKGDHGEISKTSIEVTSGTLWSAVQKPTVTPETGYVFSKWVDSAGNDIADDYEITSNFSAKATYAVIDFSNDSWANVCKYANEGIDKLKEVYGVTTFIGCERTIILNGKQHIVRVIGQNHDSITDTNSTAALTFELKTLLSDSSGETLWSYWSKGTHNYDYLNSPLRKNLTGNGSALTGVWSKNALTMLEEENIDLFNNLKTVDKKVAVTSSYTVTTYSDKLFPLTCTEMNTGDERYTKEEGTAYTYWALHSTSPEQIKTDANGNARWYWLCSPVVDGHDNHVYCIAERGGWNYRELSTSYPPQCSVSFGFCI